MSHKDTNSNLPFKLYQKTDLRWSRRYQPMTLKSGIRAMQQFDVTTSTFDVNYLYGNEYPNSLCCTYFSSLQLFTTKIENYSKYSQRDENKTLSFFVHICNKCVHRLCPPFTFFLYLKLCCFDYFRQCQFKTNSFFRIGKLYASVAHTFSVEKIEN